MQKKILPLALCLMCVGLCACGKEKGDTSVQSTVSTTTTVTEQETKPTETTHSDKTTATASEKTEIAKEEIKPKLLSLMQPKLNRSARAKANLTPLQRIRHWRQSKNIVSIRIRI